LGDKQFRPFAWNARGWKYIRGWSFDTTLGWFLPAFVSGLLGLRGPRRWWVPVSVVVAYIALLYPDTELGKQWSWWPDGMWQPSWWMEGRVWVLFGVSLPLPVAALADRRSVGRVLCWGMALITIFFCVRAGG